MQTTVANLRRLASWLACLLRLVLLGHQHPFSSSSSSSSSCWSSCAGWRHWGRKLGSVSAALPAAGSAAHADRQLGLLKAVIDCATSAANTVHRGAAWRSPLVQPHLQVCSCLLPGNTIAVTRQCSCMNLSTREDVPRFQRWVRADWDSTACLTVFTGPKALELHSIFD